jgi:uncharacterized protein
MAASPFNPTFDCLPDNIPIFPLTGVLLLPGGRLPLNVFEPRYLAMAEDALCSDRLIGMIQPSDFSDGVAPPIFSTGCAGRIISFAETDDGRYLITLLGLCRFSVVDELPIQRCGYRRVAVDWSAFRGDMEEGPVRELDRKSLMPMLQAYFRCQGLSANWEAIESTPDEKLVTMLAMICPFEPADKQALLEAATVLDRARMMVALMQLAVVDGGEQSRH